VPKICVFVVEYLGEFEAIFKKVVDAKIRGLKSRGRVLLRASGPHLGKMRVFFVKNKVRIKNFETMHVPVL
jgi:hypothetical protein